MHRHHVYQGRWRNIIILTREEYFRGDEKGNGLGFAIHCREEEGSGSLGNTVVGIISFRVLVFQSEWMFWNIIGGISASVARAPCGFVKLLHEGNALNKNSSYERALPRDFPMPTRSRIDC